MDVGVGRVELHCGNGLCSSNSSSSVCLDNDNMPSQSQVDDNVTQTQPSRATIDLSQVEVLNMNDDDHDDEDDEVQEQKALLNQRTNAFEKTARTLRELANNERQKLKDKTPQQNGAIYAFLAKTCNDRSMMFNLREVRARAARGVIQVATNDEYHDLILKLAASDVDNNIVSSLTEHIDVKVHGVRLFVKLLYGTFDTLPSQDIMDAHFRVAHELALECFPGFRPEQDFAVTRQWVPRLKFNNNARGSTLPMARQTTAIVWPHIVIHEPNALACFWTTLDMRLTARNPEFPNPVDVSALKHATSQAKLQTVFSHKVVPCRLCQTAAENGLADYESSDEENRMRPIAQRGPKRARTPKTCECGNTRVRVQEGSVQPSCELRYDHSGTHPPSIRISRWNSMSSKTHTTLSMHSIVPTYMDSDGSRALRFCPPPDAPLERDAIGFNCSHKQHSPFGRDLLCALDASKFHVNLRKLKTTVRLKPSEHAELYQICTRLIRDVGAETNAVRVWPMKQDDDAKHEDSPYAHLVIHDIVLNTSKKRLYVNIQGRGSRFCYLNGSDHQDNAVRVFFTITLDTFHVSVFCNNAVCQSTITNYFEWIHAKQESKKKTAQPPPNISDSEMELLTKKMHYIVPITGNTRAKLMALALQKNYCGPSEQSLVLQEPIIRQLSQHGNSMNNSQASSGSVGDDDMDEWEDSDQELDPDTCSILPRRLLSCTIEDKLAFLAAQNERKKRARKHEQQNNSRLAATEPFVETIRRNTPRYGVVSEQAMLAWKNAPSKLLQNSH